MKKLNTFCALLGLLIALTSLTSLTGCNKTTIAPAYKGLEQYKGNEVWFSFAVIFPEKMDSNKYETHFDFWITVTTIDGVVLGKDFTLSYSSDSKSVISQCLDSMSFGPTMKFNSAFHGCYIKIKPMGQKLLLGSSGQVNWQFDFDPSKIETGTYHELIWGNNHFVFKAVTREK